MTQRDDDITPAILLQHMQVMERKIMDRFEKVDDRFDKLEEKVDRNHAQLRVSLQNLDERLDDLEVVELPTIKKTVGMKR